MRFLCKKHPGVELTVMSGPAETDYCYVMPCHQCAKDNTAKGQDDALDAINDFNHQIVRAKLNIRIHDTERRARELRSDVDKLIKWQHGGPIE